MKSSNVLAFVTLLGLLLCTVNAQTKPTFSPLYSSGMTSIYIAPAGNITVTNGYLWFSGAVQSLRIQGMVNGIVFEESIEDYPDQKMFIITNNKTCTLQVLNGMYEDPLQLLTYGNYVNDQTVNNVRCHHWRYNPTESLSLEWWTSMTNPPLPVRFLFAQGTVEGTQLDYFNWTPTLMNGAFYPPSYCPTGSSNKQVMQANRSPMTVTKQFPFAWLGQLAQLQMP